jgi:hypothetical protein
MAVTIEFYTYGKKLNSTATPSGTPGLTAQCELREGTDQLSPSIILNYANPVAFNYAHIEAFSRYYFINEWTWDGGLWVGSLTVDVLASWKNTIRAYSQYVTRSASQSNDALVDNFAPVECVPTIKALAFGTTGNIWVPITSDNAKTGYRFYLMVICQNELGVAQYCMTAEDASKLIEQIALLNEWERAVNSAILCFAYYPFDLRTEEDPGTPVGGITLPGGTTINLSNATVRMLGRVDSAGVPPTIFDYEYRKVWTCTPDLLSTTTYLNYPPFLDMEISFKPFGSFTFNYKDLEQWDGITTTITLVTRVSRFTGESDLALIYHDTAGIERYVTLGHSSVRTDIPIGSVISNAISGTVSVIGDIVGAVSSFAARDIAGGISSGVSAIGDAVTGFTPSVHVAGQPGNPFIDNFPLLIQKRFSQPLIPNSLVGKPLYQYVTLSTLSGFCKCSHPALPLTCSSTEHNQIISLMEEGFFLE